MTPSNPPVRREAGRIGRYDAADRLALPAWMPVLRRGTDGVQVGLDPDASVVLSGVPDRSQDVLGWLDGTHTIRQVRARAFRLGIDEEHTVWMLRMIEEAGLLRRIDDLPDRIGASRVRLVGSGVLAHAVARNLLTAGVGRLYVADPDGTDAGPAAKTLCRQLSAQSPSWAPHPVRHWSKPEHPPPDLTVIAVDMAEPQRTISDWLTHSGHPHLFVRPLLGGATIGPMVHPGRSPCIGCLDHVRRDADPEWPRLLDQLGRCYMPMTPVLTEWAGVATAVQVLAVLTGQDPVVTGTTLETVPDNLNIRVRQWPMHTSCGCAWYG